jgi:CheY-like chemotaxis protein
MSVAPPHPQQSRSRRVDLSLLGHELRAPLNTVLGMAEILADGALSPDQRAHVEMLRRAGNRLLVLVNELLDGSLTPEAPARAPGSARDLAGVRVLVVDDDEECRAVVEVYLARTGARLTLVATGGAALEAIAHQPFDVVLLDMRLPGQGGLEVVRAIRQAEQGRGVAPMHVVALSADVHPSAVSAAFAAGCSGHLAKPLTRGALFSALATSRKPDTALPAPALRTRFLSHRAVEITAARAALGRRDFEHLATFGHNLQGSGSSYGFPGLSELGRRIEAAAGEQDAQGAAVLLTDLASAVLDATSADAALPRAKALSRTRIKTAERVGRGAHRAR